MEELFPLKEAARLIHQDVSTLRRLIHAKRVRAMKTPGGGAWRISATELRRLLGESRDEAV